MQFVAGVDRTHSYDPQTPCLFFRNAEVKLLIEWRNASAEWLNVCAKVLALPPLAKSEPAWCLRFMVGCTETLLKTYKSHMQYSKQQSHIAVSRILQLAHLSYLVQVAE